MTELLLLAAAFQKQEAPETALVHGGTPIHEVQGAGKVEMQWHTVSMELTNDSVRLSSVSLFKNQGKEPVTALVKIPIYVKGWSTNFGRDLKTWWADESVSPVRTDQMRTMMARWRGSDEIKNSGVWYVYKVSFRPQASRSLETQITLPLSVTGADGMERQVGYLFDRTSNPLETINLAVKYPQELVFQTIETSPTSWKWEVGPRGAFVKRENATLRSPELALFRFYRGGYEKIGDGK